jgi:filamentous hemagglutinin family protein
MKYGGNGDRVKPKLLAVSVAACFAVSAPEIYAQALPTGVTPVTGVTNWSSANGVLTISTIGNSVLHYNSFSIGANNAVLINQSSSAAASLQRVVGSGGVIPQSVIDGLLQSNGRVFLLNPSGIVIGAGARIDVAGFVASSLNLSDDDFLKGRMRFGEDPTAKAVKNYGTIQTASGGNVYLIAPEVENSGVIRAPQGQILLAAGKSAELVSDASPYVTVKVVADSEKALNVGQLIADSGKIGIFGALVQNSGVAEANGAVRGPGGEIRFVATKDLTLDAGSRVSANGTSGGKVVLQAEGGTNLISGTVEAKGSSGTGGEVQALGVRVGVVGHGIIDASGETGGGTVLVGGDYHGGNASVQNAERTYIGTDGVIRADAGANGDGGRVIVWADGDTRFYGSISARGGSQSGNGGFVETSGKQSLVALGSVNASAPNGKAGTWLLDPTNIDIVAGSGADDAQLSDGAFLAGDAAADPAGNGVIGTVGIGNAMAGGTAVTLQASNDIRLQTLVDTSIYGQALTLDAGHDIALQSYGITTGADLVLKAGNFITGTGPVNGGPALASNGGNVVVQGTINFSGPLIITANNSGHTITTGAITAISDNSNVTLTADSDVTTGPITTDTFISDSTNGVHLTSSYGNITVNGDIRTAAGAVTLQEVNGSGNIVVNGSILAPGKYSGQNGGSVIATANTGSVAVSGDINTIGGNGGFVSLQAASGTVAVNGAISTAATASGGSGGSVFLEGGYGVSVGGLITTNGADGVDSGFGIVDGGGSAGSVVVYGFSGNINIGGIQALGGAGASTGYGGSPLSAGSGGNGGFVFMSAVGAISVGSIETRGGPGGNRTGDYGSGGFGGGGGTVELTGGSIAVNLIDTRGGPGGSVDGTAFNWVAGFGGDGGFVSASASGDILIPTIDASGGAGGSANATAFAGGGGWGGGVSLTGNNVTVVSLTSRGGAGGDGGEGGPGGWGGFLTVSGTSLVQLGVVDLSGGNAGIATGDGTLSFSDSGGSGGDFSIGGDTVVIGLLQSRGGTGMTWTNPVSNMNGGRGGDGGEGFTSFITASTSLTIGPKPQIGKAQAVIDLSGGAGGNGAGTGVGGDGGIAGGLQLDPISMTINGVIVLNGGAPGAGAAPGIGGSGGNLAFVAADGLANITFVNGGWDLTAGAGGVDGVAFADANGTLLPDPLNVTKFVWIGPGNLADIPVDLLGIFHFNAVSDPLAVPEVLQVVGVTNQQTQQVAEGTVDSGGDKDKDSKDKEKTGSLGSCRPS